MNLDMNPVLTGVQLAAFPAADANGNGISDVEEILLSIRNGTNTFYGRALQAAYATFGSLRTAAENANTVLVSDGEPQDPGGVRRRRSAIAGRRRQPARIRRRD